MENCKKCGGELQGSEKSCPACGNSMEQVGELGESSAPKKKLTRTKKLLIVLLMLSAAGASIFFGIRQHNLNAQYRQAIILFDDMKYDEAKVAFAELENHKDASEKYDECVKEIEAEKHRIQEEKERIEAEERQRAEEERLAVEARQRALKLEKYGQDLSDAAIGLMVNYNLCFELSNSIAMWYDVIFDRKTDFNAAASYLLKGVLEPEGYIDSMLQGRTLIHELMANLYHPYDDYKESYEHLLKTYGVYTEMYTQAASPSGTYQTYKDKTHSLDAEFASLMEQWSAVDPAVFDAIEAYKQSIE